MTMPRELVTEFIGLLIKDYTSLYFVYLLCFCDDIYLRVDSTRFSGNILRIRL